MYGVKLAGPIDVVGVIAVAAEEAHVLLAANGCTDAFEGHGVISLLLAACYSPLWRASTDARPRSP